MLSNSNKAVTNRHVDEMNAIMLAVLGLYETLELFNTVGGVKYWVEDYCFCFEIMLTINKKDVKEVFRYPVINFYEPGNVLNMLENWCEGATKYVE